MPTRSLTRFLLLHAQSAAAPALDLPDAPQFVEVGGLVTSLSLTLVGTLADYNATSIRWELATDAAFSNIIENPENTNDSHSFSATTLREYYARAVAINDDGSTTSETVAQQLVSETLTPTYGSEIYGNGVSEFTFSATNNMDWWVETQNTGTSHEFTEVDSGQLHGGTNVTGGSVNFYRPNGTQNLYAARTTSITVPLNTWYEAYADVSARSNGLVYQIIGNGSTNSSFSAQNLDTAAEFRTLYMARGTGTANQLSLFGQTGGGVCNVTIDRVSLKTITPVSAVTGQVDGTTEVVWTRPGSPLENEAAALMMNINSAGNFWAAYVIYEDGQYNAYLRSYANGVYTNRETVSNVGSVDGVGIVQDGSFRRMKVLIGGNWFAIGSGVTVSLYDSDTGVTAVCNSGFTLDQLRISTQQSYGITGSSTTVVADSENGDDGQIGSEEFPVRTFAKALQLAGQGADITLIGTFNEVIPNGAIPSGVDTNTRTVIHGMSSSVKATIAPSSGTDVFTSLAASALSYVEFRNLIVDCSNVTGSAFDYQAITDIKWDGVETYYSPDIATALSGVCHGTLEFVDHEDYDSGTDNLDHSIYLSCSAGIDCLLWVHGDFYLRPTYGNGVQCRPGGTGIHPTVLVETDGSTGGTIITNRYGVVCETGDQVTVRANGASFNITAGVSPGVDSAGVVCRYDAFGMDDTGNPGEGFCHGLTITGFDHGVRLTYNTGSDGDAQFKPSANTYVSCASNYTVDGTDAARVEILS